MSRASLRCIAVTLSIAVIHSASALAQDTRCNGGMEITAMPKLQPRSNTRMVVLDFTRWGERGTIDRMFSLSANDTDPDVQGLRKRLLAMLRCVPDDGDVSTFASPVVDLLDSLRSNLSARSSLRWISTEGDKVEIYLLRSPGHQGKVDVDEKPRQTRLSSDLVTLAELAQEILVGVSATGTGPDYSFTYRQYVLTRPRANLKIIGSVLPRKPDATKPDSLTLSLTTGPTEHFFLSANVANTTAHQFKYNQTTQSIQPIANPKEFFVGLDYTLGDIFDAANPSALNSFKDGIYLGLMLEASSRPFNQVGVSLGFRHNPIAQFVNFDAVSPFVAAVWARSDRVSGSGAAASIDSKYGKGKVVFGLSLNLDKALGWVGK